MVTQAEAIELASRKVQNEYAVVPPVATVLNFARDRIEELMRVAKQPIPSDDVERVTGKWCVFFRCSWDTDAQGLPLTLAVLVDDRTGESEWL